MINKVEKAKKKGRGYRCPCCLKDMTEDEFDALKNRTIKEQDEKWETKRQVCASRIPNL
jgi:hypothetical protein